MDPQTEEALVASKLDHLATEYSQLLVGQLEQQRAYYDGLLQRGAEEAEAARRQAQQDCSRAEAAVEAAQKEAKGSERARKAAEQKLVRDHCSPEGSADGGALRGCLTRLHARAQGALAARMKELEKEWRFFKEVNAQLELNQGALEKARKGAEESRASSCAEKDARIQDLEEQVGHTCHARFWWQHWCDCLGDPFYGQQHPTWTCGMMCSVLHRSGTS